MKHVQIRNFMKLYIKENKYSGSCPFCSCIHRHTALHVGHSENKEHRCLAPVTKESCPSDGEGSPQSNWKALQSKRVQNHWSKCFYFHIKLHKINFSELTPFVSWMHHIQDYLLVKYKPTAHYIKRDSAVTLARKQREPLYHTKEMFVLLLNKQQWQGIYIITLPPNSFKNMSRYKHFSFKQ
jgi:hypothetical protein